MKTIGATKAGEQGIQVANRVATLVENRGGAGRGFIAETTIRATGLTNRQAVSNLAIRLGWNPAEWQL